MVSDNPLTFKVKAHPFRLVGPVLKLIVECPCGCGALTDAPFRGTLWVAAKQDVLFFGAKKGFSAWAHRTMLKRFPPDSGGKLRIVVMKSGRLLVTDAVHLFRMSPPHAGARSIPQDEVDSLAGWHLAQPPPDVSVVGYTGPLVAADPPRVPRIELLMVAESAWTLSD